KMIMVTADLDGKAADVEKVKKSLRKYKWIDKNYQPKEFKEVFPARLYCGQSLRDSRRESIIIDYSFSDLDGDIDDYRPVPDNLAGGAGMRVRDEIRMVRPGFYLGRAYMDGMFAL